MPKTIWICDDGMFAKHPSSCANFQDGLCRYRKTCDAIKYCVIPESDVKQIRMLVSTGINRLSHRDITGVDYLLSVLDILKDGE